MNIINIYENYNSYFNADLKTLFETCSKTAQKHGYKIYLIGGIVRDLLLNIESRDIDITVEGDAIEFARILERECAAKISSIHHDFGTVKVYIGEEHIDLASTRSETYPDAGHLPLVAEVGCSLEKDVSRRDFTINSLAISLNQENFAHLIDYVGGHKDLGAKKIRILHEKSFVDDPTRIIRALKYSIRLGFELDENTLRLQEEYLKNVNYDMCNKRVKNELKLTFNLNSQLAFDKFVSQKIYKLITKNEIKEPKVSIQNLVDKYKSKHPWLLYFGVIAVFENDEFLEKLELTKVEKDIIVNAKNLLKTVLKDNFEIYKAFCSQKIETLLILAVLGREKEVLNYLDNLKKIKISITGKDLLALGFKQSNVFSEMLDFALKMKLKNPKITKAEELKLIKSSF